MSVNGEVCWSKKFTYTDGTKQCGNGGTTKAPTDELVAVKCEGESNSGKLTVRVHTDLDQGAADESFAIDNVVITKISATTRGFYVFICRICLWYFAFRLCYLTNISPYNCVQFLIAIIIPSPVLSDAVFDLDASAQSGGQVVDSIAKIKFTDMETTADADGVKYFDLTSTGMNRTGGGSLKEGKHYTHAYVLKWRAGDTGYRTLLRHSQDHCAMVNSGSKDLGMFSDRKDQKFSDSGYDVVPQQDFWEVLVVTGKGNTATGGAGTSTFYTMDQGTGTMKARGTVDRVCTGKNYARIGNPDQGPGKIARVVSWKRVLTVPQITALRELAPSTSGK